MDGVAEGLWELADQHEKKGEIGKAVKCLEAVCQSTISFLPIAEVKTSLRIATILLKHSHNYNHAKQHLERSSLLQRSLSKHVTGTPGAIDLVVPVYRVIDSYIRVREKTAALFAHGFLLMRQENLQEARIRLANELQITHGSLGNLLLVSQYLTVHGNLALALHDTGQAKEILRSSLTLAKKLYDLPTQIWVLTNMRDELKACHALLHLFYKLQHVKQALYKQTDEKGNEMENAEYLSRKTDDLQKKLADGHASIHHLELIGRVNLKFINQTTLT